MLTMDTSITNPYTLTGIAHSVVANRISYVFNFKGPSMVVDTACASSFTAIHLACSSLWNGECTLAVAGGANPVISPEVTVGYSALGVLSPEGMSCPFSDTAKGYVRSEGWGTLILKPLDAAVLANDHIYAVIPGTAIASNGASKSLTMPCTETQKMVMRMAYERFDIPMESVRYVEAHGTGTPVGDPIEAKAIGETFGRLNETPIKIGSVKSNFGHTECSSGVTSAIKVALMLERKQLVPSINFNKLNPTIALDKLNIAVQTTNEPIESDEAKPYRVGLNSFGFAGAVAHVILQEAPAKEAIKNAPTAWWKFGDGEADTGKYIILPLSAKTPEALRDIAAKWQNLSSDVDALHISAWQATRREHHAFRLTVVADSPQEFRNKITEIVQQDDATDDPSSHDEHRSRPKICFVFPGQGQQWYDMGRKLYAEQPIFRNTIDDCDRIFTRISGWSLLERTGIFKCTMEPSSMSADVIEEIEILQPSIHFLQIGLTQLWRHWGVYPDAVVGHSLGEVAAAYAADAVSLEEAITVVYHRSLQQGTLTGTGGMAALRTSIETTEAICKSHPDVYVAAINGPGSITLSGDSTQIADILANNSGKARQLRVSAPFHTPYMDSIQTNFRQSIEGVFRQDSGSGGINVPKIPFYSAVTGKRYKQSLGVDYWWENIRRPVQFQSALDAVLQDNSDVSIFLEVAATATLRSDIQKTTQLVDPSRKTTVITTGRRNANDQQYALLALGEIYKSGVNVNWNNITHNAARWAPGIPTYPWQHQHSLWIETEDHRDVRLGLDDRSFKGKHGVLSVDTFPFLTEYQEDNIPVFPASGFIEYISEMVFDKKNIALEDVSLSEPLPWPSDSNHRLSPIKLELIRDCSNQVEVVVQGNSFFRATIVDHDDVRHENVHERFSTDELMSRFNVTLSKADFYYTLQAMGITIGSGLQVVDKIQIGDGESLVHLISNSTNSTQQTLIARLNAAFHASLITVQQPTIRYRLDTIGSLRLHTPSLLDSEEGLLVYTSVIDCDGCNLISDVLILSESGLVIGQIDKLTYRKINNGDEAAEFDIQNGLYTTQWQSASAKNLPTSSITEAFNESSLIIPAEDWDAVRRAEDMADNIEDICISYIKYAMEIVPESERAQTKRYHKSMAIFDAITTQYTRQTLPFDEIPAVMGRILEHCPELEVEMRLTKRLGDALPDTLRQPRSAVPIMFSSDCLDSYFWDGLSMKFYYIATANAVVRSVMEALKSKQVVRVLELGARIGGLTRFIVSQLTDYGLANRLEYVVTDVSTTFFGQARKNLSAYPFVQYQLLSVEKDVEDQGFVPGSFDIVICLDTLHVAVDARRSTRFMSDLLVDEGVMYLLEGTNSHYLTELWFGCMDVCLVFDDERTEVGKKSCWFHREGWLTVMRDVGLQDVISVSSSKEFYHCIVVGRKSVAVHQAKAIISDDHKKSPVFFILEGGAGTNEDDRSSIEKNEDKAKTLGEELILLKNGGGSVNIIPFSEKQDLGKMFNCIENPVEIVYIPSERDVGLVALLRLLEGVGRFPSQVAHLWIVIKSEGKLVTASDASILAIAQAFSNRTREVAVQSIRVANDCPWSRVAHVITSSTREHALSPPDNRLFLSRDSIEVLRMKRYTPDNNSNMNVVSHWQVRRHNKSDFAKQKEDIVSSATFAVYNERQCDVPEGCVKVKIQAIPISSSSGHHLVTKGSDTTTTTPVHAVEEPVSEIQCVGVVEEIHSGGRDTSFSIGEEVVAFGQISLGSHAVCDSKLVIPNDADYSLSLTSFITAYYALHRRAKVDSNDTVLIQMSDEPVCLAAIEVAKYLGCHVIRAFSTTDDLGNDAPIAANEHVVIVSSRNFKDSVLELTNGIGVGVVFVSSPNQSIRNIQKILSVMTPDGSLFDTTRGRALAMIRSSTDGVLMGNKVLHYCQTDVLLQHQPDEFRRCLHDVVKLLEAKDLHPIPYTEFDVRDILQDTVDSLQGEVSKEVALNDSKEVALKVLKIPPDFDPPTILPVSYQFLPNATYIITDGYGLLAQALARWLFKNGAKSIALISSDDVQSSSAKQTMKHLRRNGIDVQEYSSVDLGVKSHLEDVLQRIRSVSKRPIKGIFHLDTIVLTDQNLFDRKGSSKLSKVIASTVTKADNLNQLTLQDDLDIFLTLSSHSSLFGLPSNAVSSATNAFLDALSEQRHSKGLPALSIQVGPMRCMGSVIGVPETESRNMSYAARKRLLEAEDFLRALGELLVRSDNTPVICLGYPVSYYILCKVKTQYVLIFLSFQ